MFDKLWFIKHQRILLKFANSFIGRYILRIYGKRSSLGRNKIIRILPNSITWKEGKYFKTEFRTHDKFGKRLFYAFYPIWYLLHLWDMAWYPNFNLGFDSLTKYPNAGTGTAPMDLTVYRGDGVTENFSTIRNGDGMGNTTTSADVEIAQIRGSTDSNTFRTMSRSMFGFDLSSISGASVTSAIFSLYGTGITTDMGSTTLDVVSATPTNEASLDTVDYAYTEYGSTVYADVAHASYNTSAYNDLTLDASGVAYVITKLGLNCYLGTRLGWDTDNSFGGSWGNAIDTDFLAYTADQTGTTNDPKLVVTYSLPSGFVYISV